MSDWTGVARIAPIRGEIPMGLETRPSGVDGYHFYVYIVKTKFCELVWGTIEPNQIKNDKNQKSKASSW